MAGSAQLVWPDDARKTLGLTLLFDFCCEKILFMQSTLDIIFFYSGSKIIAGIHSITGQLIIPFVRDYKNYVQSKEVQKLC